jgi:hypothetical protein
MSQKDEAIKQVFGFKNKGLESMSGPGSSIDATPEIRVFLPYIFEKYEISTVVDAPCGDMNWMRFINLNKVNYLGIDIVDEIVSQNVINYPGLKFMQLDIISNPIPYAECYIIRDFFIHLLNEDVLIILNKLKKSKVKYLISTSFPYLKTNIDQIEENHEGRYGFRKLNLSIQPYNLGAPIESIVEKNTVCEGRIVGLWELI